MTNTIRRYVGEFGIPTTKGDDPDGAVALLLRHLGEDPSRDGLRDTPGRVVRALEEMTSGYAEDPGEILSTTFDVSFDEMIIVRDLQFASLCEHHLLPFTGTAAIAYIPGKVVGLSKLARLLDCFARRLQVQEKMTSEIADAIEEHLDPVGVGVVIRAHHSCMALRGVRKPGEMITSTMRGVMFDKPEARAEFLALR